MAKGEWLRQDVECRRKSTFRANRVSGHGRGHFGDHYGDANINEVHHHHYGQALDRTENTGACGAELAGSVLELFPQLISGLGYWTAGIVAIPNSRRILKAFQRIKRAVELEHDIIFNQVQNLLKESMDDLSLRAVMHEAGQQERWENPLVDVSLRQRLGRSYSTFSNAMSSMEDALEELREGLLIDDNGEVPFSPDESSVTEALGSLKMGLKMDSYSKIVAIIKEKNEQVQDLGANSTNRGLEPIHPQRRAPDFDAARSYAARLFAILQDRFTTSCSVEHRASLYLNPPRQSSRMPRWRDPELVRLRVVLHHEVSSLQTSLPWMLEEAEIQPLAQQEENNDLHSMHPGRRVRFDVQSASSSVASQMADLSLYTSLASRTSRTMWDSPRQQVEQQLEEVQDLCRSFQKWRQEHVECRSCLGYLLDASDRCRHGLFWPENRVVDPASTNEITLAELLKARSSHSYALKLVDRRKVALALANGILQLHDTPWLEPQWGKNEVVLFAKAGEIISTGAFISAAMASQSQLLTEAPSRYFQKCRAIKNETIFALGIVLIELALQRPFEDLKTPEDLAEGPWGDFNAADRLIKKVENEAGPPYASVVRRCIWCEFDHNDSSLADRKLQEKVYAGVVAVLQEEVAHLDSMALR